MFKRSNRAVSRISGLNDPSCSSHISRVLVLSSLRVRSNPTRRAFCSEALDHTAAVFGMTLLIHLCNRFKVLALPYTIALARSGWLPNELGWYRHPCVGILGRSVRTEISQKKRSHIKFGEINLERSHHLCLSRRHADLRRDGLDFPTAPRSAA